MHDLEANCLRTVKRPSRESGSPKYPNEKCTIFKMRTYPGPDRYTQVRPRRCTQAHAGTRRGCTSALSHPVPGYPCQLFCLSTVAISIGLSLFFPKYGAQRNKGFSPGYENRWAVPPKYRKVSRQKLVASHSFLKPRPNLIQLLSVSYLGSTLV